MTPADFQFVASLFFAWSGFVLVAVGVWEIVRHRNQGGNWPWLCLIGGALFLAISTNKLPVTGDPLNLRLPLFWPVTPFPAWFLFLTGGAFLGLVGKWVMADHEDERRRTVRLALGWAVFGLVNFAWFKAMAIEVEILRGYVPLPWPSVVAAVALMAGAAWAARTSTRALRRRNVAAKLALYAGLSLGTVVFALPVFWMLLTSFKEAQDNTGSGLVWVPRVTQRHAYTDPERPLVQTTWQGERCVAAVVSRAGSVLQLDIERPYPLRGFRIEVPESATRPAQRYGDLVTLSVQAKAAKGFVLRDLAGGTREIELLEPPELAGRRLQVEASQVTPVRAVGLRGENYAEALEWLPAEAGHGLTYVRNTLWLVLMTATGTLLSCSLVAYGFARLRFPGRKALFWILLATLMLPGAVTMLPKFMVWRNLGAIDTLVPVWLPHFTSSAFNVFLICQFFRTLPKELEDAAKIDGCSPLRTYWKVMLPQIKPVMAVIGIWAFMGAWNDFMGPLIYVSSQDKMPVAYALQLFSADKGGEFGMLMAMATLATAPVLLVFLLGQRYLTEGINLSGLGSR